LAAAVRASTDPLIQLMLAIDPASTPANSSGVHIDVTDQNRADGFSPGAAIDVQLGPIDAANLPGLAALSATPDRDATVVVLDATTGKRVPIWAELDSQVDPGETPLLMVHPARNFADGHRIVVAVRGLLTPEGARVQASSAFAAYRDGQRSTDTTFEARRPSSSATVNSNCSGPSSVASTGSSSTSITSPTSGSRPRCAITKPATVS